MRENKTDGKICIPTWHQILLVSERFVRVMNDEAVLDKETGLVWEQSPSEICQNWAGAKWYCYDKMVGNRKGWRLPTAEELASLVDTTQQAPCLPSGHPFNNVRLSHYWTITSHDSNTAYIVHFSSGVVNAFPKSDVYNVWCVRGGHGYDGY
jgi:hypothetical protein